MSDFQAKRPISGEKVRDFRAKSGIFGMKMRDISATYCLSGHE